MGGVRGAGDGGNCWGIEAACCDGVFGDGDEHFGGFGNFEDVSPAAET